MFSVCCFKEYFIIKIGYRVDKRNLKIFSRLIPYDSSYFFNLNYNQSNIEKIFESQRPKNKIPRNKALYLFTNKNDALKHWLVHNKEYFIYSVIYCVLKLNHIGDYNLLEDSNSKNDFEIKDLASKYWKSELSDISIKELLLKDCFVFRKINLYNILRSDFYNYTRGYGNQVSPEKKKVIKYFLKKERIKYNELYDDYIQIT